MQTHQSNPEDNDPRELSQDMELTEYVARIARYDAAEEHLAEAMRDVFRNKTDTQYVRQLQLVAVDAVRMFARCVDQIYTDAPSQTERIQTTAELLYEAEQKHRLAFTQASGCTCTSVEPVSREYLHATLEHLHEEIEDELLQQATIANIYTEFLQVDVSHAMLHYEQAASAPHTPDTLTRSTITRRIAKHALDVLKISGGVAMGIIIANHLAKD